LIARKSGWWERSGVYSKPLLRSSKHASWLVPSLPPCLSTTRGMRLSRVPLTHCIIPHPHPTSLSSMFSHPSKNTAAPSRTRPSTPPHCHPHSPVCTLAYQTDIGTKILSRILDMTGFRRTPICRCVNPQEPAGTWFQSPQASCACSLHSRLVFLSSYAP